MYLEYEWQLLPMKTWMAAILDLFFSETLKITNNLKNEFSIKNNVEMRYYIIICLIVQELQLQHSAWRPFWILWKKYVPLPEKPWDFLQVLKEDILVVYRFKSYVSQILMTINLLSIKHQIAAILDFFFNETLKFTTSFRNESSIKNHVEMRYYIKIYVK